MTDWIAIRGDGSDPLPPLMATFEARLRNGATWTGLAVTPFCLTLPGGPFRHRGAPDDPVEYRMTP